MKTAIVNGQTISPDAINFELDRLVRFYTSHGMTIDEVRTNLPKLQEKALDQAIGAKLLFDRANQLDLPVTAKDVDAEVARVVSQVGSEENYKKALEAQGITEEAFRKELEKGARVNMLVNQACAHIDDPTEEEVTKFYEAHKEEYVTAPQVLCQHILIKVDDSDPKLSGTVPGGYITGFRADDRSFRALASESIPKDRKFIERLGLDIAGLAAEKQRDDTTCGHDIDLIGNAAVSYRVIPTHNCAADNIVEDTGIDAGLVSVQLQNAADITKPCPGILIPEAEGDRLIPHDREILDQVDSCKLLQGSFIGGIPGPVIAFYCVVPPDEQRGDLTVFCRRYSLNIGNNIRPITPEAQKARKEGIKILQILGENPVIHTPGEQCSACH